VSEGRRHGARLHGDVAMRAARRRQGFLGFGGGGDGPVPQQAEHGADERERALARGMVQSVVADFHESRGQDVLEEAADELRRRQLHMAHFLRLRLAVAERDAVAVVGVDGGIGDGDAVDVAREVAQGVLAVADGFGMHHPLPRPGLGGDRREHLRQALAQSVAEARAEDLRERLHRHEKLLVRLAPGAIGGKAAAGGDEVDVGVVHERAAVRMQHARQARPGAEPSGVGADVQQRRGRGLEEEGEAFARMRADGAAQFLGHGEGAQVVAHRQEEGLLPAQPHPRVVAAAGRAMPVAAGVQRPVRPGAPGAFPPLSAQRRRAARHDRAHGLQLVPGHAIGVPRPVGRAMTAENLRQGAHATAPSSVR